MTSDTYVDQHKVKEELDRLKAGLSQSYQLKPFSQKSAKNLVRFVEGLGSGQYKDVRLEVNSGCDIDGRWWYTKLFCRDAHVATVHRRYVKWHNWSLYMHMYIMNVLGQTLKAKREAEELAKMQEIKAKAKQLLEKDILLVEVAESFNPS